MLPIEFPLPRTSISFGTGAVCFLAHAGSAAMASGLSVGAFPSKVTVPVTVEAAKATPGQINTATTDNHSFFPVQRMLGSFVVSIGFEQTLHPDPQGEQAARLRLRLRRGE